MYNALHGHNVKIFSGKTYHDIECDIKDFINKHSDLRVLSASTIMDNDSIFRFYTTVVFHDISKND